MSPSRQRRRLGYFFPHHTDLIHMLSKSDDAVYGSLSNWNGDNYIIHDLEFFLFPDTSSLELTSRKRSYYLSPSYTHGRSVFITTIAIFSSLAGMHLMHLYLSKLDGRLHRSGILTKHSHSFGWHVYWWVALFYLILPRLFLSLGFSEYLSQIYYSQNDHSENFV